MVKSCIVNTSEKYVESSGHVGGDWQGKSFRGGCVPCQYIHLASRGICLRGERGLSGILGKQRSESVLRETPVRGLITVYFRNTRTCIHYILVCTSGIDAARSARSARSAKLWFSFG